MQHNGYYRYLRTLTILAFMIISTCGSSSFAFAATVLRSSTGSGPPSQHTARQSFVPSLERRNVRPTGREHVRIAHDWTPTFDEEFSNSAIDTSLWNIEDDGTGGYRNCCLSVGTGVQYFTTQALSLNQGVLHITSNNIPMGSKSYTSGALTTENKFSFLYGRVDISARLPKGKGMWPALWLLTGNQDHEVNIMEMANDPTIIYQTAHLNVPVYNSSVYQCIVSNGQDFSTDFHTYSLEWYPTSLTWYIDGVQTCQSTQAIPQTPMYLLLDTAVGGKWPGLPDATTVFPQDTALDYVKVSQAPPYMSCTGLQVTGPLQMAQATIAQGGTINATVTYTNNCTTPFSLNNLIVAARMPAGQNADFGNKTGAVTVLPGQSVTINASRLINTTNPTGQWYAFSSFQTPDGVWHPDGTNLAYFTVTG